MHKQETITDSTMLSSKNTSFNVSMVKFLRVFVSLFERTIFFVCKDMLWKGDKKVYITCSFSNLCFLTNIPSKRKH